MKIKEILKENIHLPNQIERWMEQWTDDYQSFLNKITPTTGPLVYVALKRYNVDDYCGEGDDVEAGAETCVFSVPLKMLVAMHMLKANRPGMMSGSSKTHDTIRTFNRVALQDDFTDFGYLVLYNMCDDIVNDKIHGRPGPWEDIASSSGEYYVISDQNDAEQRMWHWIDEYPPQFCEGDDEDEYDEDADEDR